MPGPIAACAKSTGAMLPFWRSRSACGNSRFSDARKSLRVVMGAESDLGRQARTIEEAKRVRAHADAAARSFGTHGPSGCCLEARPKKAFEHSFPASRRHGGGVCSFFLVRLHLLERVVDGEWVAWRLHCSNSRKSPAEALFEELLRSFLAPVETIGSCNQLLFLRGEQGRKQVRIQRAETAAQPDIEEIGKVCVPYIVVVRRVGGHDAFRACQSSRIQLTHGPTATGRCTLKHFQKGIQTHYIIAGRFGKHVGF